MHCTTFGWDHLRYSIVRVYVRTYCAISCCILDARSHMFYDQFSECPIEMIHHHHHQFQNDGSIVLCWWDQIALSFDWSRKRSRPIRDDLLWKWQQWINYILFQHSFDSRMQAELTGRRIPSQYLHCDESDVMRNFEIKLPIRPEHRRRRQRLLKLR